MPLLTLHNAHLAFGLDSLLESENFSLETHERVGLIGRNGQGKSSLLKVLAQTQTLDSGSLQVQSGIRVAYLAQEPLFDPQEKVFDAVAHGLADVRQAVQRYTEAGETGLDSQTLEQLHSMIETNDGWNWQQRVEQVLSQLELPSEKTLGELSGGWKKRVALAQALVQKPAVLLLDEPTNHLDLEAIVWLGQFLTGFAGSIVVVSHDRAFLDQVSTRIIELDRGKLSSYSGNLSYYLRHKEEELAQEALANARADKMLSQEEAWIRQGVEGRRTRSVARIGRLEQLRKERQARRDRLQNPTLTLDAGEKSGKLVAELDKVVFNYPSTNSSNTNDDTKELSSESITPGQALIQQFSAIFLRGDKVAIVGPNGCGKTTLLKLILGQLQPSSGKARQGSKLHIAYFDQMRATLDESASLEDFISPGSEWVEIAGKRKHVKSYLGDFLFPPSRAHAPVSTLSGGERNRLLLARLFALPANVLVLDEPTNDLDLETIDLLESLLQTYSGTIFLVSHDRSFLNNVVTSTIAYEGQGRWCEYAGGVDDYLQQRARSAKANATANSTKTTKDTQNTGSNNNPALAAASPTTTTPKRKLSYKEQRALEQIPQQIEDLETEQAELRQRFLDPTLYSQDPAQAQALHQRDADIETQLQTLLERWEELDAANSA